MKNLTLFACLLVLTLGASAQSARSVSPVAIPPDARGVRALGNGITVADHVVKAQSDAAKPPANGGPQGPPTAKVPPSALKVPALARK